MLRLLILSFFTLCFTGIRAQDAVTDPFTSLQSRTSHRKYLEDTVIKTGLATPPVNLNSGSWNGAFWGLEILQYHSPYVQQRLGEAWKVVSKLNEGFQKNLLEASYTLYPVAFVTPVKNLMLQTNSVPVFIRCAEYLLRASTQASTKALVEQQMNNRFAGNQHPGLAILQKRLHPVVQQRPSLKELFDPSFLPGQTVIFSFQRSSRNYPGMVVIRKPDGSLVKNAAGQVFSVSQLARAMTGYPYYITNGNTPQGLLRWTGLDTSESVYIGSTPNLQLVLPFEATPAVYFNDSLRMEESWTKEAYAALLPKSWKNYAPIFQAYEAGSMGRNEIIMHGTTIDPRYYKGQTYFPQTPSLGCLCSYEEWDASGRRVNSNQQQIVDALLSIGATSGYVMVIDLDDRPEAVKKF
jgi:hypothetical protein